jgi:nicotinamide mononucleotide transporter
MRRWGWVWLLLLTTTAAGYCLITRSDLLPASVLLSGTICVALIALGRREGYLIGLYNSLAYAWIAWQNGLFGEVWLNLAFYLPTGIIGYLMWSRRQADDRIVLMRALHRRGWLLTLGICLVGTAALGWGLGRIATQNTPYIDAATNVLSVVATILMMWRYREQWVLYFALNALSIIMWILRWVQDGTAGDAMVVMWSLFLINSVAGWWRWSRGCHQTVAAEGAA